MKVKSKGRKNSKKGTKAPLLMMAAAEQTYAFQRPSDKVKNENFAKYERFSFMSHGKQKSALTLPIVRKVGKIASTAEIDYSLFLDENVNNLLRNILLFKGIGFNDVEKDVRLNGKTTYAVNVVITFHNDAAKDRAMLEHLDLKPQSYKLHTITVKKTFRNDVNVMGKVEQDCNIFFDSDTCRAIRSKIEAFHFKP